MYISKVRSDSCRKDRPWGFGDNSSFSNKNEIFMEFENTKKIITNISESKINTKLIIEDTQLSNNIETRKDTILYTNNKTESKCITSQKSEFTEETHTNNESKPAHRRKEVSKKIPIINTFSVDLKKENKNSRPIPLFITQPFTVNSSNFDDTKKGEDHCISDNDTFTSTQVQDNSINSQPCQDSPLSQCYIQITDDTMYKCENLDQYDNMQVLVYI